MSELTILYPIRKSPDWLVFMCAVVHGLDNFRWISERSRAFRSGKVSGFIETWRNVGPGEDDKFNVELFSPFEAELISIIAEYEARYPYRDFETRIGPIEQQWDGYVARGSRLRNRILRFNQTIQFAEAAE